MLDKTYLERIRDMALETANPPDSERLQRIAAIEDEMLDRMEDLRLRPTKFAELLKLDVASVRVHVRRAQSRRLNRADKVRERKVKAILQERYPNDPNMKPAPTETAWIDFFIDVGRDYAGVEIDQDAYKKRLEGVSAL